MISNKRLEKIYEIYELKYEQFKIVEELTSKKSFEYMVGYFARINISETMSNEQLAFNFLDSENRSEERLNQAMNRLASSSEWEKQDILNKLKDYLDNFEYEIRNPNAATKDKLMEVYEDLKTLQDIRMKAITDPEYRKAFIEAFLIGTNNDQTLLKAILSPDGFDED